jgi:hypothetical protein
MPNKLGISSLLNKLSIYYGCAGVPNKLGINYYAFRN